MRRGPGASGRIGRAAGMIAPALTPAGPPGQGLSHASLPCRLSSPPARESLNVAARNVSMPRSPASGNRRPVRTRPGRVGLLRRRHPMLDLDRLGDHRLDIRCSPGLARRAPDPARRKRGRKPERPPLPGERVSAAEVLVKAGTTPGPAARQPNTGRAAACRTAQSLRRTRMCPIRSFSGRSRVQVMR